RAVQIGRPRPPGSREPRVTDRAADEHRRARAAGGRLHGAEQRPGGRREVLELEDGGTHDTSAPEPAALNATATRLSELDASSSDPVLDDLVAHRAATVLDDVEHAREP